MQAYFTAIPNKGAGFGHQIANWNAGYWFAKFFNVGFAHSKFSNQKLDDFLGFGNNEVSVDELLLQGYTRVILPLFTEDDKSLNELRKLINLNSSEKLIFVASQDQYYGKQFGVMEDISKKFESSSARQADNLIYSSDYLNIAVHIRLEDLGVDWSERDLNLRLLPKEYYLNLIDDVISCVGDRRPVKIFIFSNRDIAHYAEFNEIGSLIDCTDMDPYSSFLHLVRADVLITAKSGFSYIPALISKGIKICPQEFWHGYPQNEGWILASKEGRIDLGRLNNLIQKLF